MVGYTLGASGAVFGLMGAYFVIARKLGAQSGQLVGLIAINLAFGFFMPGISWQAHVGGLAAGCLVALLYVNTRQLNQKTQQLLGLVGIFALVVGVMYAGLFLRVFPALGL
jgi:membrane associated rhomboid family serine protease